MSDKPGQLVHPPQVDLPSITIPSVGGPPVGQTAGTGGRDFNRLSIGSTLTNSDSFLDARYGQGVRPQSSTSDRLGGYTSGQYTLGGSQDVLERARVSSLPDAQYLAAQGLPANLDAASIQAHRGDYRKGTKSLTDAADPSNHFINKYVSPGIDILNSVANIKYGKEALDIAKRNSNAQIGLLNQQGAIQANQINYAGHQQARYAADSAGGTPAQRQAIRDRYTPVTFNPVG